MDVLKSPYPDLPPSPDVNVSHVFLDRPEQQQAPWTDNHVVFIELETGKTIRWNEFVALVKHTRTALSTAGFKADDLDYPLLVHVFLSLRIPFALIAPHSTSAELAHALKLTGVKTVFAGLTQTKLAWPKDVEVITMNGSVEGLRSLHQLQSLADGIEPVPVTPAKKSDLAYLAFSSGTSGLPKAVQITHGNITASVLQNAVISAVNAASIPADENRIPVTLAFLPMYHSYGLHVYGLAATLMRSTFILVARWDISRALDAMAHYKVDNMNMIPSAIAQLAAYPSQDKVKKALRTLTSVTCGAAYLPPELWARFASLLSAKERTPLAEGYGMTEVTLGAIVRPTLGTLGRVAVVEGSCGVLRPGLQAKILDESLQSVGPGKVGELWLKGDGVVPGYFGTSPEVKKANAETFVDGWLRTGDRFWVDEEGNFFFADRAKDTLKVSGHQVSPSELENIILSHPQKLVSDVAVAGVSGGRTQDERVPRAWIVLSENGKTRGQKQVSREIQKWCEEQLSKFKWLRGGIEVIDEIPKNPVGKTLRRQLVEQHEKQVQAKL